MKTSCQTFDGRRVSADVALLTAIGAVERAALGFFDLDRRDVSTACGSTSRWRSSGRSGQGPTCAATETIGAAGGFAPSEPKNGLSEKLKMPPSSATIR